jgi:hypothetical protein
MKKIFVLMLTLFWTNALADKIGGNLAGFALQDLCGSTNVSITIDNVEDKLLSSKLTQVAKDQDILFGSKFGEQRGCKLHILLSISIMNVKSVAGSVLGYAYSYSFIAATMNGRIKVDNREINVLFPSIYDFSSMGVTGASRSDIESVLTDISKQSFQDFLLDWRKTH